MQPEIDEVRRWLLKARHDWSVAKAITAAKGPETDVAAFHCQQAIEKMLKAYLVSRSLPFEKVHDLGRLIDHCATGDTGFESLRRSVSPLTLYAVVYRYPGPYEPSRDEVVRALEVVQDVWDFVTFRIPAEAVP